MSIEVRITTGDNVRSGCHNGLWAASGWVNVPNFNVDCVCVCNLPLQKSFALVPVPDARLGRIYAGAHAARLNPHRL